MPVENNAQLKALDEQLIRLLRGETAETVEVEYAAGLDPVLQGLCETVNLFIVLYNEAQYFIRSLAEGNLEVSPPPHNLLASPFKQLQANLLHLTWQAGQIAAGDYSQRVHFMGAFSSAFNSMVEALEEKRRTETLLRETQARVKHLEGIIPICSYCKKIRDDQASWQQMEQYISDHSEALFSHSICPECFTKARADLAKMKEEKRAL